MIYSEALAYIHSTPHFKSEPTLERMRYLCNLLGNPQDSLKFVHVAGTNGKGSVTAMTTNILINAGYKVGRFISPYIMDFCERMEVNGTMISQVEVCYFTEIVSKAVEKMKADTGMTPIEFEIVSAIGFMYFQANKCDIVVLEVGLGGLFDPTNIIQSPLISVIMIIDFDHMELLGDTISKIAYEKCGIIKADSVTVAYPLQSDDAKEVIFDSCNKMHNKLIYPDMKKLRIDNTELENLCFNYNGKDYKLRLNGIYQIANAVVAIEVGFALQNLGYKICDDDIYEGIYKTYFPARFEILHRNPLVIFDGAHNSSGIESLKINIQNYFPDKKVNLVIGMLKDKIPEKILSNILSLPNINIVYTVPVNSPRRMSSNELYYIIKKYHKEVTSYDNIALAVSDLIKNVDNDIIICFGSLYLAVDIKKLLS